MVCEIVGGVYPYILSSHGSGNFCFEGRSRCGLAMAQYGSSDNSRASMLTQYSDRSTVSSVSQQLECCRLSEEAYKEKVMAAKTLLQDSFDKICRDTDVQTLVPHVLGVLPPAECEKFLEMTGRGKAVQLLMLRVIDQKDLGLYQRIFRALASQNPGLYMDGKDGWSSNDTFKRIVGIFCKCSYVWPLNF